MERRVVDVAVIGAGMSGLSAARRLRRAGRTVVVLEARDRIGGKVWAPALDGHRVDLGAHWLDARHVRARALAAEFDVETVPQSADGRHVMQVGGGRREFAGDLPLRPLLGAAELAVRVVDAEIRARRVPAGAPWTAARASRWDSMTLGDWMAGVRTAEARGGLLITCRTIFGAEPDEVSLLFALDYFRAGGGLLRLMSFDGGAQDLHLVGGMQQIADGIAAELGDVVVVSTPVRAIAQDEAGVDVRADELTVRATHAIVATAPATLADVEITPALERPRAELHDQMPLGAYAKAVLVYPTRWWAERGLSGIAFSDQGLVQMTVDAGHPGGPATMAAFVTGDAARSLSPDPDARRAQMLDAVVDLWGPDAAEPSAYQDHDWSTDAWARGGPVGLMGPGTLTQLGTHLHPPTGRIHWAGTERSPQFTGYIEGAIVAGEAAADAILHDAPPSAAAGALEQAIEVSTVLPATPEEVWAIIDDTSRYAEWADSVIEVVEHHGSARVGETYVEKTTTVGPLTAQTTWTVRESGDHWRRDTGEGLPMLSGVAVSFHTRATDEANATRLTYRFTCTTPSRRSRLAFRALRGAIRKDLEHSLEALRTLLA